MTVRRRSNAEVAAMQYLTWALEDIERIGNQKAALYTRRALEALRKTTPKAGESDSLEPL